MKLRQAVWLTVPDILVMDLFSLNFPIGRIFVSKGTSFFLSSSNTNFILDHLDFMWKTSVSDKLALSIVRVTVSRAGCCSTRVDKNLMGFFKPQGGGRRDPTWTSWNIENIPYFLIIKPTRCTNFSYLLWKETLHVSDSSSVHHQEFFTVHTAMLFVIQVVWQPASRIRMEHPDPACRLSANLYDIYHRHVCTVKNWWWTEELSETCRVSFQNKLEKLMHLVGLL